MSSKRRENPPEQAIASGATAAGAAGDVAAFAFQRDLYLYWRAVADSSSAVALTGRGYVARPALRRLRAALAVPAGGEADEHDRAEAEDLRLLFIRRLLQRLSLLGSEDGKLTASERHVMARYLAHPLAERLRICVRVWSAGGWWPDAPDPRATPPRLMAPAPPRLALARRRLVDELIRLSPGEPVPLPVNATAGSARRPSVTSTRRGRVAHVSVVPGDTEAATRYAALTGPLAWLGLVSVRTATAPPGQATHATTATMATAALAEHVAPVDGVEPPGRVVIQPNFEIVAYPPLTAPTLLLLDTCAERESLDLTARYRLARASLARARAEGWATQDIAARLEALSGMPLPANIRVTLDDWERHVERITLTDGVTLLEVRDAALLDTLLADRAGAAWVERRLTATAALLATGSAGPVRAWLLRRGELPALRPLDASTAE